MDTTKQKTDAGKPANTPSLEDALKQSEDFAIADEIRSLSADEITGRARLIENEIKMMKGEITRLTHEQNALKEKIKENSEKIKLNKQLPYLVGNIIEVSVVVAALLLFFFLFLPPLARCVLFCWRSCFSFSFARPQTNKQHNSSFFLFF
jgi:hypothetical protein